MKLCQTLENALEGPWHVQEPRRQYLEQSAPVKCEQRSVQYVANNCTPEDITYTS